MKPQPGYVIVDMGDAEMLLTNGVIRNNMHRVEQTLYHRYSVGHTARPEEDAVSA